MNHSVNVWCRNAVVVGVAVIVIASPQIGFASCAQSTLDEQIVGADVVAVGEVETQSRAESITVVELETVYKGSPENPVQIASETPGAITSVDVNFTEGSTYLLMLRITDDGTYTTNTCNGTRNLTETPLTDIELASLGAGAEAVEAEDDDDNDVSDAVVYAGLGAVVILGALFMTLRLRGKTQKPS